MKEELENIQQRFFTTIQELKKLLVLVDSILEELEPTPQGITNIQAVRDADGTITITWDGNSQYELDVTFSFDPEEGKWHSIKWMMNDDLDIDEDDYNPLPLIDEDNVYVFTPRPDKPVTVELLEGTNLGEGIEVVENTLKSFYFPAIIKEPTIEEADPRAVPVAFWYPDNLPEDYQPYNCYKTWSPGTVNKHLDKHDYCQISISHTMRWNDYKDKGWDDERIQRKNEDDWESVIRGYTSAVKAIKDHSKVPLILLADEPQNQLGLKVSDMAFIIRKAREHWGEECNIAFSYTTDQVQDRRIPNERHIVLINFYPFFREEAEKGYIKIFNEKDFQNYADRLIDSAIKVPAISEVGITSQVFWTKSKVKWRKPPVESPEWHRRLINRRKEIVFYTHWAYSLDRKIWGYLKDMPELKDQVLKSNQRIINGN